MFRCFTLIDLIIAHCDSIITAETSAQELEVVVLAVLCLVAKNSCLLCGSVEGIAGKYGIPPKALVDWQRVIFDRFGWVLRRNSVFDYFNAKYVSVAGPICNGPLQLVYQSCVLMLFMGLFGDISFWKLNLDNLPQVLFYVCFHSLTRDYIQSQPKIRGFLITQQEEIARNRNFAGYEMMIKQNSADLTALINDFGSLQGGTDRVRAYLSGQLRKLSFNADEEDQ